MAAPGGSGPIGPYPPWIGDTEDDRVDYDKLRRRVLWSMPYGLYIVGSADGDRMNGMTANWVTQLSFEPKLVGIGVETSAFTHELIAASGVFSVNTVARDDRALVRKFTKPVEVDLAGRTLNGFAFTTRVTGAPVLDLAPAFLDCTVIESVPCGGGHTLHIGEVVDCGFQADEDTAVLRMEDTRMSYGG